MPGAAGIFKQLANNRVDSTGQPETPQNQYFQQAQPFNSFSQNSQMPPPMLHDRTISTASFNQSPASTGFAVTSQSPMPNASLAEQTASSGMITPGWVGATFDPHDAALIDFDLASMNFGNHYGALEFGMLGHMANNAGEDSASDNVTQRGSVSNRYHIPLSSFSESPNNQCQFNFNDPLMGDWTNAHNVYAQQLHRKSEGPHAFTIENNAGQFTSPETNGTPQDASRPEDSPIFTHPGMLITPAPLPNPAEKHLRHPPHISTPHLKAKSGLPVKSLKRLRDPSAIYTSVEVPYPYTVGFHSLIAYLQERFAASPSKTLAIAKSLASTRPTFIATTKTLNRDDLIFMEKCFQRTLLEYEGFIEGVGTPTIVARRTGEIAAVGKEFQILTGWTKNILLGKAPNLNANRGHTGTTPAAGSGVDTTGRSTGLNTPQKTTVEQENGEKRQQPVFLAELLDDDTVVQFYEDFARLAFGDSRGSVMGRGKLLKYRTKEDELGANLKLEVEARGERGDRGDKADTKGEVGKRKDGISGEKAMQKLGSADGKVNCAYCWTVKRDVFDIPMLIIMNVSLTVLRKCAIDRGDANVVAVLALHMSRRLVPRRIWPRRRVAHLTGQKGKGGNGAGKKCVRRHGIRQRTRLMVCHSWDYQRQGRGWGLRWDGRGTPNGWKSAKG